MISGNIPRRHASLVSKNGIESLATLSPQERAFVANDIQCPIKDDYYKRFVEVMSSHPGQPQSPKDQPKQTERGNASDGRTHLRLAVREG